MDFFKKWFRNHKKNLLHFLIHTDVLMLCSKFELIPTSIFRVTVIFKNEPKCIHVYMYMYNDTKRLHCG